MSKQPIPMALTPVTTFELQQLKLAARYYEQKSKSRYNWRRIITYTVILIACSTWLCFTFSWWLIPVLGIIQALIFLSIDAWETPKTVDRYRKIVSYANKAIETQEIETSSYQGVRALRSEPYDEVLLFAVELVDEKTLILHDADYTLGGMLYLGNDIKTYDMPFATEIFGQSIYSTSQPIPVQTINSEIYADIFFTQGNGQVLIVPKSLEQLLDEAIAEG